MESIYDTITRPTLLVDEEKTHRNICRMKAKTDKLGLALRPHFKTHQSATVGQWFRDQGIRKITVSSVDMAEYFAEQGFNDITLAFPVNIREIERINSLMEKIKLHLLIESVETVQFLNNKLQAPARFFIKINTGYHRAGVLWHETRQLEKIIRAADTQKLRFSGFLTHEGRTYQARNAMEVAAIHQENLENFGGLKDAFINEWPDVKLSYGDTPTASIMNEFAPMDELRPGNYVFYDLMQQQIGSCDYADIAVAMACPVVAKHKERNELVIYGGAVHFSKDALQDKDYGKIYGKVVDYDNEGWGEPYPGVVLDRLSQEHGIVKAPDAFIEQTRVGDLLMVLPVHSCLTASNMRGYFSLNGQQIGMM